MGDEIKDEAAGRATPEFVLRVGEQIRHRRRARGWTVQELADAADVSRRMLTQIELGQANPSLVTIDRVAAALGTGFTTLALAADTSSAAAVTPVVVWEDDAGSQAVLLGATDPPAAELWQWTLAPGARYEARPDRPGTQEIHHVLAGQLTVTTEAEELQLGAGQTAAISSDQRYAYENRSSTTTFFHRVVSGA